MFYFMNNCHEYYKVDIKNGDKPLMLTSSAV